MYSKYCTCQINVYPSLRSFLIKYTSEKKKEKKEYLAICIQSYCYFNHVSVVSRFALDDVTFTSVS